MKQELWISSRIKGLVSQHCSTPTHSVSSSATQDGDAVGWRVLGLIDGEGGGFGIDSAIRVVGHITVQHDVAQSDRIKS